jgi:hypothetical protein
MRPTEHRVPLTGAFVIDAIRTFRVMSAAAGASIAVVPACALAVARHVLPLTVVDFLQHW